MNLSYKNEYFRYQFYYLRLKKISQQPIVKTSFTLIFSLFLISILAFFALKPTLVTIAKLTKEVDNNRRVNEALDKKINSLKQAEKNFDAIEQNLPFITRTLPTQVDFNRLASKINFLAFFNELTVSDIAYGGFSLLDEQQNNYNIPIKITVGGTYPNIKHFLSNLENLSRLVNINSISLTRKSGIKGTALQAEISAMAYWLSEGEIVNDKQEKNK